MTAAKGESDESIPTRLKRWMLFAGPLIAAAVGVWVCSALASSEAGWTAGVAALCALWWVTEPIPIPATSLLPLAAFPLVGVLSPTQVGESFGSPLVLLMMGGFMLSTAMTRSGAHRRISLQMVRLCGHSSGRRLVFGFMAASALLSMWISNTATAIMLLPIALAVAEQTDEKRLANALLLGIAYGASIGGIGTPIGTPPNLVFMEVFALTTGTEPTFVGWMSWSLPIVAVMVPLAAIWLTRSLGKQANITLPDVGERRPEEVRTLAVFAVTALLWTTRTGPWGGWSEWVNLPGANEASVALLAVWVMCLIPNGKGEKLLDWETAVKIPWGVLILFGSGIAIAKAFTLSGLSEFIGQSLSSLMDLPTLLLIVVICLAVTFLTEITSNTATATLLMPILAAVATSNQVDPRLLMVPATISASFTFMLPVATPPNAIVFGSNRLTIQTMVREGLLLNLLGAAVVSVLCYWLLG